MIVDLVFESGIAARVGARLAFKDNGSPIRHDQPRPDEQQARLAEGDGAVVLADQPRAPRDQQVLADRAVIDRLRRLGGDLPRQVRPDSVMRAAAG
jgi:hypothetical protein